MVIEYFLEWIETATVTKRTDAARALAKAWLRPDLDEDEREDVEAAVTTLLDDPAPRVRLALAEEFGAWDKAPRHVMAALAADNPEIATVVLSQSPVFMDAELVDFVRTGGVEQQIAVSCRPRLTAPVVAAVCCEGVKESCLGLLMNSAARFSAMDLHNIAARFGSHTDIRLILSERPDVVPETRLILIEKLGEALAGFVSKRDWMPENRLKNVITESCDKATINYAATANDEDVMRIVQNLIDGERLNASFLLRAVCMGNISMVAAALSALSGVDLSRVENVLTRDRQAAFRAIYDRAGMPSTAFDVFQLAISTWRRLLLSGSPINQARLPFMVTKEVLETYTTGQDEVVDELLVLLRKLAAQTARESAEYKAMEIADRSRHTSEPLLLEAPDTAMQDELGEWVDPELFNRHFVEELARLEPDNGMPSDLTLLSATASMSVFDHDIIDSEFAETAVTAPMANAA